MCGLVTTLYMMTNTVCSITHYLLLYNIVSLSHNLKYTNIIHAQSFSLFVDLYETRYDQHNYFWYNRPSTIDPFL